MEISRRKEWQRVRSDDKDDVLLLLGTQHRTSNSSSSSQRKTNSKQNSPCTEQNRWHVRLCAEFECRPSSLISEYVATEHRDCLYAIPHCLLSSAPLFYTLLCVRAYFVSTKHNSTNIYLPILLGAPAWCVCVFCVWMYRIHMCCVQIMWLWDWLPLLYGNIITK